VDDAGVLSKASQGAVLKAVKSIEESTGYKLEVVTVRKLVFESDPFAFADQVIENWFPTVEEGDKVGVLVVTTTSKVRALPIQSNHCASSVPTMPSSTCTTSATQLADKRSGRVPCKRAMPDWAPHLLRLDCAGGCSCRWPLVHEGDS